MDGSNLESKIVSNAAKVSLASCCSYEYLYKYTFDFLSWMKSMNIQIEEYYDDVMSDMDKVKTDLGRKKGRVNRSAKLIAVLDEDYEQKTPKNLVDGVGYPRMCIQCVRSAVDAFLRTEGKRRYYACSDPDRYDSKRLVTCREIAKCAEMHKCYVLTGDYDYAVFPVEGIIDVSLILKAYDGVYDSILTIPRYKVLNALHLTDLKMIYIAVLCGNDFYPSNRYDRLKDTSDNEDTAVCLEDSLDDEDTSACSSDESDDEDTPASSIDGSDEEDTPLCLKGAHENRISVVVKHIATLPSSEADLLEDCMTQFPNLSPSEIEKRFSKIMLKYNTKAYPSYPQSCLPQSIDDDVFALCGITNGNCVPFPPFQMLSYSCCPTMARPIPPSSSITSSFLVFPFLPHSSSIIPNVLVNGFLHAK